MTQSLVDYRASMEHQLRVGLSKLRELHRQGTLKMQHNDENLGFTENAITHSTLYMTVGSFFQSIGEIDNKMIIVYVTDHNSGFGLYNEGDPEETCLPIDIHELVFTWFDEPAHFQRDMLGKLRDDLDNIIEQST